MHTRFFWYHTDTVIYVEAVGIIGRDDIQAINATLIDMLNASQSQDVYFIYDVRGLENLPAVTYLRGFTYARHPRTRSGCVVGLKGALRAIVRTTSLMFRTSVVYPLSIEAAIAHLQGLPNLKDLTLQDLASLDPYTELKPTS